MQRKHWMSTLSLLAALATPAVALAHMDHGKPQMGGVVAEAGEAQFEIVGMNGMVMVHATQHGMPVAMSGGSGKLTVLEGTAKREIALKAAGDNRLSGEGKLEKGAKLLLNVQMPGGKTLQARAVAP